MTKKVLISTGGSGGHVIPAITIYNHIKHKHETFITTDKRGLAYLDKDYKVFVINTPKLNNYFLLPFSFLKIFYLTVKSFLSFFKLFFFLLNLKLSQLIWTYLLSMNHHNLKRAVSFQWLEIILY